MPKWRVGADCEERGQKTNEHEQNANEEVTMATSHGSTPPGTCHTDVSVENKRKRTYQIPKY